MMFGKTSFFVRPQSKSAAEVAEEFRLASIDYLQSWIQQEGGGPPVLYKHTGNEYKPFIYPALFPNLQTIFPWTALHAGVAAYGLSGRYDLILAPAVAVLKFGDELGLRFMLAWAVNRRDHAMFSDQVSLEEFPLESKKWQSVCSNMKKLYGDLLAFPMKEFPDDDNPKWIFQTEGNLARYPDMRSSLEPTDYQAMFPVKKPYAAFTDDERDFEKDVTSNA